MTKLEIVGVYKSFCGNHRTRPAVDALSGVDIRIMNNELVVLLGPSGCGKSTLLRLVAGLDQPDRGQVMIDDIPIRGPSRQRGMIFQDYALFPWRSVLQNIEFGPELARENIERRRQTALDLIEVVGLTGFEHRYPHELSGGMQQRVAIARVLINHPELVLMDEPFASLDAQTRSFMQRQLLRILQRHQTTILFVTHSVEEALILADTIYLMSPRPGRIQQRIAVDMARPRNVSSPGFVRAKAMLLDALGNP